MNEHAAASFVHPSPAPGAGLAVLREVLSTSVPARWPEPPPGHGRPAMLVPGFLAGDASLARMAQWLRRGEWRTTRPGIRLNVDCMAPTLEGIERRLEDAVVSSGQRALLVGQSRGGTLGRILAVRRPDLIETLVTLGSPVRDQMAVSRTTRAAVYSVGALGSIGVPGLFSYDCMSGDCCRSARDELARPLSEDVRWIAVYSRADAVVSWEACVDPAAEVVEVAGTHSGMGMSHAVWSRIAELGV